MTATVTPATPGRTVALERWHNGQFRVLASGVTNRTGTAQMKVRFATTGTVRLRAFAEPTGTLPLAVSAPVTETVAEVLPVQLPAGDDLVEGDSSPLVTLIQQRLTDLGYWIGTPDGYFGDATEQAVFALEKAAGLARTGVIDDAFVAALNDDVLPRPRSTSGYVIEIDLADDLLMVVDNGTVRYVLNTSTGGGYTYTEYGATETATTPTGVFSIYKAVDGLVTDPLGQLWRPRFFTGGYAIHGDSYVPAYPVSHGCARVSNEAINWIWADNIAPIGTEVWVY